MLGADGIGAESGIALGNTHYSSTRNSGIKRFTVYINPRGTEVSSSTRGLQFKVVKDHSDGG